MRATGSERATSRRHMADGLDIVTVQVEHEGAIVARVVVRPQTRCAIVLAAGCERGAIESIDRGAVLGHEGDVDVALWPFAQCQPEIGLAIIAKADIARAAALLRRDLHGDSITQRS